MPNDHQDLARSMAALTIGTVKGLEARRQQRELEGLQEYEEQFKIDISGTAEEFATWSQIEIAFGWLYVDASGQRDSPYDRPHFTYGVEINEGGPVGIMACVLEWITTDRNETTGCVLAMGPVATDVARTFRGSVHARFQGYGMPADPYGDMTQLDIG